MYNVGRSCFVSGAFKLNQEHILYNYSSSLRGRLGDGYTLRVLEFLNQRQDFAVYELHPQDPHLLRTIPHISYSSTMVVRMPPSVCSGNTHIGWKQTSSLWLYQVSCLPCLYLVVTGVPPSLWTTMRRTPLRSKLWNVVITVILLCWLLLKVNYLLVCEQ